MGSSSKKTTSNTTQQQQSGGTTSGTTSTTPDIFAPAKPAVQNYYDAITGLGSSIAANPYAYTAQTNPLQQQAYSSAQNLGGWQGLLGGATGLALNAASAPANLASAGGVAAAQLGPAAQAALQKATAAKAGDAILGNAAVAGPAASLLDGGIEKYLNPYLQNVRSAAMSDMDIDLARQRANAESMGAKNRAFGGSTYSVSEAALAGEQARARTAMDAGLLSAGFDRATGLASDDANRRQQTSLTNAGFQQQANIANQAAQNQFKLTDAGFQQDTNLFNTGQANATSQFNTGQTNSQNQYAAGLQQQANNASGQIAAQMAMFNAQQQDAVLGRQMQAAGLLQQGAGLYGQQSVADTNALLNAGNSRWETENAIAQAPLQNYGAWSQLLNSGLLGQLSGQTSTMQGQESGWMKGSGTENSTQKSSGGLLGTLGSIAQIAGTAAKFIPSDRRLKTDIRRVGRTDAGLPVFTYRYKGEPTVHMGVMAQDVEQMQPRALGPEIGGYRTVNYEEVR